MPVTTLNMGSYNRVGNHSERGRYDRDTLYSILDESLICHVAFVDAGRVFNIPMLFARQGDSVYIHSSIKGRIYGALSEGAEICLTATILDGIVVAKSAFHSSMNYRSAMIFGKAIAVEGNDEKVSVAKTITEKMINGRWKDCRLPKESELKATGFLKLDLKDFSCKVREGDPVDDPSDVDLPFWSGVVPISLQREIPRPADRTSGKLGIPEYLKGGN